MSLTSLITARTLRLKNRDKSVARSAARIEESTAITMTATSRGARSEEARCAPAKERVLVILEG